MSPSSEDPRSGLLADVRDALRGAEHDYTAGRMRRAILLLAIPMVLEMAMESVFALVDVYFVSSLGADAVAAVGLTEATMTLVYAVAIGLAMATTATVARRIGERDKDGAVTAATQALVIGVVASVLIGLPAAFFAEDILRLMSASEGAVAMGSGYATVMFATNVVIMLLFLNNAIFRGAGDAVIAMRSLWLANGINIVLDPCLILGLGPFPEMGVTGAAVATAIGRGAGVVYQLRALRAGRGRVRLAGPAARLDLRAALRLLRVSLGGIGQFLIATASWVALMRLMAPFGSAAVAGYTIAIRILVFAILPSWGLANAAATLVGQNLGAGQPERAARSVWLTGTYNMAFLGAVAVVMVLVPDWLMRAFTDDPDVHAVGVRALRVIAYGYPFFAWGMVMVQAFNGAGDTRTPTWINFFCFWCFQIPLAWWLSQVAHAGPDGVFWAVTIAESLLAVVAMLWFRRGTWKAQVV